ncbi:hypothetical protein C8R46DRAFT_1210715 [Mycena filopes]|nr:hypothetical protein C8R46DRAFT_1210715 [Mycena filopes]
MSSSTVPLQLSQRPLNTKLIDELKAIAGAMGLDTTVKKALLLGSIQRHIKENPGIAEDPQFLPLFAHRTPPTASAKTSAGKAAEDESESSKSPQTATGANKALLEQHHKLQPPAQFKRLTAGRGGAANKNKGGSGGNDLNPNSDESSEDEVEPHDRAGTPETEAKPDTPQSPQKMPGVVQVNFFDESNHAVALRQVIVDDFPVVLSTSHDGSHKFSALLSELVPAAIKNDSPIKERGGRMYRPNIRDDPGHHHIGKIEALLAGTSSALKPRPMNEYSLRPSSDGTFYCDLFWDAPPDATTAGASREIPDDVGGHKVERLVFTGQGSDIPLAIATSRAKNDPLHKDAAPGVREAFALFVHAQVQAAVLVLAKFGSVQHYAVPEIPDFGEQWAVCTFAGQMLDRYLLQERIFKFLEKNKWSRAKGLMVPRALGGPYAGVTFNNDFLLKSLC